jgi:hypothetical protein
VARRHYAPTAVAVVWLLAAGLATAGPASAGACDAAEHRDAARRHGPGPAPLIVGDSVLLGAVGPVSRVGYEVDAKGCRTVSQGLALLRERRRAGRLPGQVALALGTNFTITVADVRRALGIVGGSRLLVLVAPRDDHGADGLGARAVRAAGRRWPDRVRVVDWAGASASHADWRAGDGIHLTPSGASALARMLRTVRDLRVELRWQDAPAA